MVIHTEAHVITFTPKINIQQKDTLLENDLVSKVVQDPNTESFPLFTESSHTPPSDDFTNLLKGLLKNNPDERSGHANPILCFR